METEVKKSGLKITFIVLIGIVLTFVIYYSIMAMLSPVRKLDEIKNEFVGKASEKNESEQQILKDSTYLKLLKEKAFLQSRLVMAETDSIYLSINLADSSINIDRKSTRLNSSHANI